MERGLFGNISLPDCYSRFPMESNGFHNQEFCNEDNINQCLAYISQELTALGYPAIYNDTSSCPYAVNCDIIKFLNVTFDLLHNNRQLAQIKEDFESRNRSLLGDLNAYKKKLNHTKNNLEQSERKCYDALERERQLKERCEQLQLQLKVEKDEAKKSASISHQQKVAFHHEIRKLEKEINQMKTKMNQLLADRNSLKKVASMSSSYVLQRNDGQRGKWKTGATSNSRLEEMFTSAINDQESRCKEITEEMVECCSCLKFVQKEILDLVSSLKECGSEVEYKNPPSASSVNVPDEYFYTMFKVSGKNLKDEFKEKIELLKTVVLESCRHQSLNNGHPCNPCDCKLPEEITIDRCNSSVDDKIIEEEAIAIQNEICVTNVNNIENGEQMTSEEKLNLENQANEWKMEQEKIDNEKLSLIQAASSLRKEKEAMLAQKLELIKLEMKLLQNKAPSGSEQVLSFTPATSVITTNGSENLDEPILFGMQNGVQAKSPLPSWIEQAPENQWISKSENSLSLTKSQKMGLPTMPSSKSEDLAMYSKSPDLYELPKWATSNHKVPIEWDFDASEKEVNVQDSGDGCSNEDSTVENGICAMTSPSEEEALKQLKMAAEDMEKKRSHVAQ